jgi:hypothetical protein
MYHAVHPAQESRQASWRSQSNGLLASRYHPVAIPAVAAVLEVMRRSAVRPAPEASARVWAGREFD